MLTTANSRRLFGGLFITLIVLQLLLTIQTELFGDEAFYWLESRFLDWSYSEIPGFVPWLNAISTALFPQHPFFLRLPYLLACWCLPWLSYVLCLQLSESKQAAWQGALMSLILPLLGLTGVLAIADIWLLFFTLLAVLYWLRLSHNHQHRDAVLLGLVFMLAVNVHIRFWFVLFIAFVAAVIVYKQQLLKLKTLWQITLPLTLLGFVPIIIFNIQHEFPLLGFQLGERNPWQFQPSHLWFFLGQIIMTTPVVFWLCVVNLKPASDNNQQQAVRFIQLLALLYWLLYAVLGFFSDNLRTNIHWPLPSYLLLLVVAATFHQHHQTLKKWAVITGGLAQIVFLIGFYVLLHLMPVTSNNHKQLINNAIGWPQLSSKVQALNQPGQLIIADNFMTAAALNYYNQSDMIPALSHPMNTKHGRQLQLSLMNLLYHQNPVQPALLVVEHTALKLPQQIPFYQQSCQQLNGLQLVDDLSIRQGSKLYYFFQTNSGSCDIPPIIYHDYEQGRHRGWVVVEKDLNTRLIDASTNNTYLSTQVQSLGQSDLFKTLDPARYQRLHYQVNKKDNLQIKVKTDHKALLTQRFYQ